MGNAPITDWLNNVKKKYESLYCENCKQNVSGSNKNIGVYLFAAIIGIFFTFGLSLFVTSVQFELILRSSNLHITDFNY